MAGARNRFDPVQLERIREQHELSTLLTRFGVRLRKAGREWVGLSPFNPEKTPSFTVNDAKGFFHDFSSGMHGDVIDVVMHFKGMNFVEAVNYLGGEQVVTAEDRARIVKKQTERQAEDDREREDARKSAQRQFNGAMSIEGTHAADYLQGRGLIVLPDWTFDLRFVPALQYRGFADENADETIVMGEFPAMVAAIRDVKGVLIGLHRTYLDPDRPAKLSPPGDRKRNKAKKILGDQTGGLIRLSPIGRHLAMGEGIETTRSWFVLGRGGDDVSIASAVSLGNLAGAAMGSIPHPTKPPPSRIPNGEPDHDRPGVILPPDVEQVTLLGDGDSDPAMTRQRLLVAGRRFQYQERAVFIDMAPNGTDWNNVLTSEGDQ